MFFRERVEQGEATTYIDLLEPEKKLYQGAGWYLAAIENGRIIEVKSIDDGLTPDEMTACFAADVNLTQQGLRLLEWAGDREVYLGMMSCYQFCMPERFGADRLARVARLIVEQVTQ